MWRKIRRIFLKSLGILAITLVVLAVSLFFAIRSYAFQTWLGKKAGEYISAELGNTVTIETIRIDFFSQATLGNVLLTDKHRDTLFAGTISVNVKELDINQHRLAIDHVKLSHATCKIIRYKNDSTLNFNFLSDYFAGNGSDTTKGPPWSIDYGGLDLDNISFTYRDERQEQTVSQNMNYSNLVFTRTCGKISNLKIHGDTILATITNLSTKEQCGFELKSLTCSAEVSGKRLFCDSTTLRTSNSLVKGRIDFKYDTWEDYTDFLNKIRLDSRLDDSTCVSFADISPFTSELNGLQEKLCVSGRVKGLISDLRLSNFRLSYGNHTRFVGDLNISGLPDITTSFVHFNAKEIACSYNDLINIPAYPFHSGQKIQVPTELKKFGVISYRGKFDGFVNDFTTYGRFNTALGKIDSRLNIKLGEKAEDISYNGKLSTENFYLGELFGMQNLKNLSLSCEIKGKGIDIHSLDATIEGDVQQLSYNGYPYHSIKLNGNISHQVFTGLLTSADPNADFDFNGTINFNNKVPEMDFISTINRLNLTKLNFFESKADSGILSSQILINLKGASIDNLSGQINFDDTRYATSTKKYKLSTFNLLLEQNTSDKKVKLNSEYVNGIVRGDFNLSNLGNAFEKMLGYYYPSFFTKQLKPYNSRKSTEKTSGDEFVFKFTVKKFNTLRDLFLPDLMLDPGTVADGNFSARENKLNLQFSSPKFRYSSFTANNLLLILNQSGQTVLAETSGESIFIGDSLSLDNFNVAIKSTDRDAQYSADWDNLKTPSVKGEIKGGMMYRDSIFNFVTEKINVTVNDSTWTLVNPSKLSVMPQGKFEVNECHFKNHQQEINVAGKLTQHKDDSLTVFVSNLVLKQFNPALKAIGLRLEGVLNGDISLSNAGGNFVFDGELDATEFSLNENFLGEVFLGTNYLAGDKLIKINGYTAASDNGVRARNISFGGIYYLDKRDESLDLSFKADPANLRILNPFLKDILTINRAYVYGEGKIHGTPDNIKIEGKLKFSNNCEIKVDYTNVTYRIIGGEIEIMPDQIRFSDIAIRESGIGFVPKPQGYVNGNIFHNNFSRMQIDYDVTYRNMLVLNTTEKENSTFYGRVYGSGNMGIYGFLNKLHMQVRDTTTAGSRFFLPLDGPAEVSDDDFVKFVKKDTTKVIETPITGFDLDLNIYATPQATAQIILDKRNGDMLTAQGRGDINMRINTLGKFEMFGNYNITKGNYLFTLENVINKKFEIEPGSNISWSGNPFNAEIDITTTYKQRASVAPLLNDAGEAYKGRFPVDCKLLITGKLFSPLINFGFDFPNIDANAKARIANVLSDEAELNRQVFSFMLFRSFVTPAIFNTNGGGVTANDAAASTGSEMLSNRVSSFLNQQFGNLTGLKDVQLGLNYRPGNQNNSEGVDLALSKQFLNNKVSVDGNFGVNSNQTTNTNGLIGDVNINYKLSDDGRYRLKGFNRTNDNTQVTTAGGPYTQGVGFFYREEFETFNQLFKIYLGRFQKKKPADTGK